MTILNDIKNLLAIPSAMVEFDSQILMWINSVLQTQVVQLGVPVTDKPIDSDDEWSALGADDYVALLTTYLYLKIKQAFDPPLPSVIESFNRQIAEAEWRLREKAEGYFDD